MNEIRDAWNEYLIANKRASQLSIRAADRALCNEEASKKLYLYYTREMPELDILLAGGMAENLHQELDEFENFIRSELEED